MVLFYDDIGKDLARGGYDGNAGVVGRGFKGEDGKAASKCGASGSVKHELNCRVAIRHGAGLVVDTGSHPCASAVA
jgi:hypothetical protein